jgi:drug/metabolite transporter (DMT)-like permease
VLGLVAVAVAVAVVIGSDISLGGSVLAHVLPFLAFISIAIGSLIDRSATISDEKAAPILLITFFHCMASLLVLVPMAVGFEGLQAEWNGNLVFAVVWLALVVSFAAYGLMFVLLQKLSATKVARLTYLSLPVTMIMA